MTELTINPNPNFLFRNVMCGAVLVMLTLSAYLFSSVLEIKFIGLMAFPVAVGATSILMYRWFRPTPLFYGDEDGFRVRGNRRTLWVGLSNVSVRKRGFGPIRLADGLRVKVGLSKWRGNVTIPAQELPAPAHEVAQQIREFAAAMQQARTSRQSAAAAPMYRKMPVREEPARA